MSISIGQLLWNLLVVGSDVSLAAGLVLQDTILESQGKSTRKLASLKITLGAGASLVDSLDLEGSRGGGGTAAGGARCLGKGQCGGRKGESDVGLHYDRGGINVVDTERQ